MTRRRLPTRLRIVIGLAALPVLAWSTPLIAGASASQSSHSPKLVTLPDLPSPTSFSTSSRQPHDPEAEHARDDDSNDDGSCDDTKRTDDSHENDYGKKQHTGTVVDCGPPPVVGEAPLAIGLPVAGAAVGAVVLLRRRRPRALN